MKPATPPVQLTYLPSACKPPGPKQPLRTSQYITSHNSLLTHNTTTKVSRHFMLACQSPASLDVDTGHWHQHHTQPCLPNSLPRTSWMSRLQAMQSRPIFPIPIFGCRNPGILANAHLGCLYVLLDQVLAQLPLLPLMLDTCSARSLLPIVYTRNDDMTFNFIIIINFRQDLVLLCCTFPTVREKNLSGFFTTARFNCRPTLCSFTGRSLLSGGR